MGIDCPDCPAVDEVDEVVAPALCPLSEAVFEAVFEAVLRLSFAASASSAADGRPGLVGAPAALRASNSAFHSLPAITALL
jgi:predicted pyridoxine 5'-phosphate oxidase superfamily flavin-nucleotide-binding protein